MLNDAVAVPDRNLPAEAVVPRVGLPIAHLGDSPHLLQAGSLQEFLGIKCGIPFRQIKNRKIQAAICGTVERWRYPLLVLQLTLNQSVPGRTVGHDIRFADNASRAHAEWTKDALLQKVSVELARNFVDDNPERQVAQIAITT